MNEVEQLKHRGSPVSPRAGEPATKQGEVWSAIRPKADEFTVERDPALSKDSSNLRQLRKVG